MNKLNLHLGYTGKGENFQSFDLDLTKFPSLFINTNDLKYFGENDPITIRLIQNAMKEYGKIKCLKTVIIDNYIVTHNTLMCPFEYKKRAPDIMLKRLNSIISRIYKQYLEQGDNFFPYTKYLIIVNHIRGLEPYLIDIMTKLGPIGVYLVFSGDEDDLADSPELTTYLYGQLTYMPDSGLSGLGRFGLPYTFKLERFKPKYDCLETIYTDSFYRGITKQNIERSQYWTVDNLFG